MRRALHIGIFIGTLIGMSACAEADMGRVEELSRAKAVRVG